jgi:hypothetical protein
MITWRNSSDTQSLATPRDALTLANMCRAMDAGKRSPTGLPYSMPITLFNVGKAKTLAALASMFFFCR